MELSWSTFLLEIVNFLLLVWLLKHFFYRPLLDVIARRQQRIEERLADAQRERDEAAVLQHQFQQRLANWESEREKARETLHSELRAERAQRETELQDSIEQLRRRHEAIEQRQQRQLRQRIENQALEQGSTFATRLLEQAAGPELDTRLRQLLLQQLAALSPEQRDALREQLQSADTDANVHSAYELSESECADITRSLEQLAGHSITCQFHIDAALIAGVRITVGPWILASNVRDELQGFARIERELTRDVNDE